MTANRLRASAALVAGLLVTGLLLAGCVTKYVIINEVARDEVPVIIGTNDAWRAGRLLGELEERGFENDDNEVISGYREGFAVRWGGAPAAYVEEIARHAEQELGVRLRRSRDLDQNDFEVILNLPFAEVELPGREEFEVTIFTDDEARGDELLARLLALGYTNEENSVTSGPNDDFNIKWGGAPGDFIDEIVETAGELWEDVELDAEHAWDYSDDDIFINLPFWRLEPPERRHFEITVFCDDNDIGAEVLEALAELGYTNEENEVLGTPNDEFNVKYGGLPDEFLEEIAGWLEQRFDKEFDRQDIWDESDNDVFINIPGR
ncbi:hypothetical protein JXB37_08705 [candidate division WOR-3 bacterium]|nr:hypothetical protein [candidate division WOR-3 bacterium]